MNEDIKINEFIGKVFSKIENDENYELLFHTENETYKMYHESDCCELVRIEDIEGDLNNLLNTPILQAEEVINEDYEKKMVKKSR